MKTRVISYKLKVKSYCSKGFTLVEILVAIVITALVMAGVYTTFIAQQRSFTVQDQVAETQESSKIAFNILTNDLRNAGFGYPSSDNPDINGFTDIITFSDNLNSQGPDAITLVGGFRQVAILANPTVIGVDTIMITYTGSTKFNLLDRKNISIDGVGFSTITNCAPDCDNALTLQLDRGMNKPFPAGRPVYLVEDITYCVITDTGSDDYLNLRWIRRGATVATCSGEDFSDTQPVVENIEDLQFAFAVDTNDDGQVDDQNGNFFLDPGDYIYSPGTANILAVRANILATTRPDYQDPNLEPSSKPYYSSGIILENNTNLVDTDRLRRRIWSMDIALRNPR